MEVVAPGDGESVPWRGDASGSSVASPRSSNEVVQPPLLRAPHSPDPPPLHHFRTALLDPPNTTSASKAS
ncbi:hypothetical protein U9M48_002369 [Paspalum notatum var. saurae]|uniref:Uncharacterized protein n=1 Tax=Paspalum notatum var. saurae TaxID=547442 RepID=A0AAQ3PHN0_PASNO